MDKTTGSRGYQRKMKKILVVCTIMILLLITQLFMDEKGFRNPRKYTPNKTPRNLSESDIIAWRLEQFRRLLLPYNLKLEAIRTQTLNYLNTTGDEFTSLTSFPVRRSASIRHHSDFFERLNGTAFDIIKVFEDLNTMRTILTLKFKTFGNTAAVNYNNPYPILNDSLLDSKYLNEQQDFVALKNYSSSDFLRAFPKNYPGINGNKVDLTFILVTYDAYVSSLGAVYKDGIQVDPGGCESKSTPSENAKVVNEVFTISQYWGGGFYHATNENIPRIVPWLQFLRNHTDIFIHVADRKFPEQFLGRLGIATNRIITGNIHGKIVYMPAGTQCGAVSLFNAQLLNLELRQTIPSYSEDQQNKLVLIKRSTRRWFTYHEAIEQGLRKLASQDGLELVVFDDKRLPSFSDTIVLFNQAALVVGPHGAGLSNVFFSKPGTFIVEGSCPDPTSINKCFQKLGVYLGMSHFMFVNSKKPQDCKSTDPGEFINEVKIAIELRNKMKAEGQLKSLENSSPPDYE